MDSIEQKTTLSEISQSDTSDYESLARDQGWRPESEYRGKHPWVDAETFIKRGQEFAPFIKAQNKELKQEVESLRNTVANLQQTVVSAQESMETLKAFHEESTKAQIEKARRTLLAEIKEAKEQGDIDSEIEATSKLSRFDAAEEAVKNAPPKSSAQTPSPAQPAIHPEVKAWMDANPWYTRDPERTGLMNGVAERMRKEGVDLSSPRVFLEQAAEIVAQRMGDISDRDSSSDRPLSKVEGAGRSSSRDRSGWDSLPAEAKAACDHLESRLVGEGRAYKTQKEWRTAYLAEYHKTQA